MITDAREQSVSKSARSDAKSDRADRWLPVPHSLSHKGKQLFWSCAPEGTRTANLLIRRRVVDAIGVRASDDGSA